MIDLTTHIGYLMMHHDCVIVPGWGAFIANYQPAHYDQTTRIWQPPKRDISFNSSINHNDGLLANNMSVNGGISFDDANRHIEREISQWREKLMSEGRVDLHDIGFFTKQGELISPEFHTFANSIANAAFNGCVQIDLADHQNTDTELIADNETRNNSSLRNFMLRTAASIAIIVCVAAGLFTSLSRVDNVVANASLFPSISTANQNSEPSQLSMDDNRELRIKKVAESDETLQRPNPATAAQEPEIKPTTTAEANVINSDGSYYLIIASLATEKEAESYVASQHLKKGEYGILAGEGRKRVYIARGRSFDEANSVRNNGNNARLYPDAWVYIKK